MTNSKKIFRFILLVFIVLMTITSFLVYTSFINTTRITPYSLDTYVGNIYIGGLNEKDAIKQLNLESNNWKEEASLKLIYQGYEIDFDLSKLTFDADESIRTVEDGKKKNENNKENIVVVNINDENYLTSLIKSHETIIKTNDFDIDELKNEITRYSSYFYNDIRIDLGHFVNKELLLNTKINQVEIEFVNDTLDITEAIDSKFISDFLTNQIEIEGDTQFSLNELIISRYTSDTDRERNLNNNELNIIASGVYQLFLNTNFKNLSKQISEVKPDYIINPGYEAISKIEINQLMVEGELAYEYTNVTDLSFYNPNGNSYYIKITDETNKLIFTLYGAPFVNTFEINQVSYSDMIPGKIIRYPSGEPIGDYIEEIIEPGISGWSVILERITKYYDETEDEDFITEDIYMAKNEICEIIPNDDL